MHFNLPALRYGYCAFTTTEATAAFGVLVYKVNAQR